MSFYQERYLPVCNYYNTASGCRFGKYCRFGHIPVQYNSLQPHGEESVYLNSPPDQTDSFTDQSSTPGSFLDTNDYSQSYYRRKTCKYFQADNTCPYGENCKFLHSGSYTSPITPQSGNFVEQEFNPADIYQEVSEVQQDQLSSLPSNDRGHYKSSHTEELNREIGKQTERLCKFFISGRCHFGDRCRFPHATEISHDFGSEDQQKQTNHQYQRGRNNWRSEEADYKPRAYQQRQASRPLHSNLNIINIDKSTDEEISKLRSTEIGQLKKRFEKDLKIIEENDTVFTCIFIFSPSDPDWPYDVKKFEIEVTFPEQYPKQMFSIKLPTEQNIPESVCRSVEWSLNEWRKLKDETIQKSRKAELFFRPFLKWLDKNMEDIVTEGLKQYKKELVAKAAGLEFVPASQLRSTVIKSDENSVCDDKNNDENGADTDDAKDNLLPEYDNSDTEKHAPLPSSSTPVEPQKRGTEIMLRNLQLCENAATLMCQQLHIIIQCGRCKGKNEFSTPQGRVNSVECTQCHSTQLLIFRASLVHQFSSIIGYLDLDNCVPFDLILTKSHFQVGCLNCSKETKMEGLSPGHPHDAWCHNCNHKIKIAVEAVKFHQLEVSEITSGSAHTVSIDKVQKQKKDPAIQEGNPLPENGTCKHYKKSFRWLRFPCCGKCYPCDVCHDDKENHEMVYANRMICGFCCKEQSFAADRPCIACKNVMTKTSSEHWEGGKGCRDKIRMSRLDNQKYSNLSKTTSRHSQKVGDMKKKTKLRHS